MKVFNWVHRRFLHVHSGITSLQDDEGIERNGKMKVDLERHALLEHDGHVTVDLLSEWKEGILAIGTLAIGPLEAIITAKCELSAKQVEEDDDDVDYLYHHEDTSNYVNVLDDDEYEDHHHVESSTLMKVAFYGHELQKMDIDDEIAYKEIDQAAANIDVDDDGSKLDNAYNEVCDVNNDDEEKQRQVKRRVTLADLFLEESVKENKRSSYCAADDKDYIATGKRILKIKQASQAKNGLSKAKKLLKKELSRINKLNKFVKRMMKKKIHPDMVEGGKMQKDMGMQPRETARIPTDELGAYESLSSLLLQDSAV